VLGTGTSYIFGLAEVELTEKNQAEAGADHVVDRTTDMDKIVHVGGATLYEKSSKTNTRGPLDR
jgi:hypothetical protein